MYEMKDELWNIMIEGHLLAYESLTIVLHFYVLICNNLLHIIWN